MRLASFKIPYSGGIGDLVNYKLGGNSGTVVANVNRWLGQIGLDQLTENQVNALAQKNIGKLGEFLFFKLVNPSISEKSIIAAIFEMKERTVFVKLMAPN